MKIVKLNGWSNFREHLYTKTVSTVKILKILANDVLLRDKNTNDIQISIIYFLMFTVANNADCLFRSSATGVFIARSISKSCC